MAPERLTLAFSSRMTVAFGFFSLALRAAIGPAVPPPITSTSQVTSERPSTRSSMTRSSAVASRSLTEQFPDQNCQPLELIEAGEKCEQLVVSHRKEHRLIFQ